VGICLDELKKQVICHIADKMTYASGGERGLAPVQQYEAVARQLHSLHWSITLYQEVELSQGQQRLRFMADKDEDRFDFVEESSDGLWFYAGERKQPCRPVVQVRGFVHIVMNFPGITFADGANHQEFHLAVARNLVPHADAIVDDAGNPLHPKFPVLHCLWKYQRPVACDLTDRSEPDCTWVDAWTSALQVRFHDSWS